MISFEFLDGEQLFFTITCPTEEDLHTLEAFELTSPYPPSHIRRLGKHEVPGSIALKEWQKSLALSPEETVKRTFDATTQYYMQIDCKNRTVPCDHYRSQVPSLRYPRQTEAVATDTFFPSVTSYQGNTCSQFFNGLRSNRWEVFPMKSKSQNATALQDYIRKVGVPDILKSDNAQSKTGSKWVTVSRDQCITNETTEPQHPWQNPAEPQIGALNMMVKRAMAAFNVPLRHHDWCQKWRCDVFPTSVLAHPN